MHFQVHEKVKEFRAALLWDQGSPHLSPTRRHRQHWLPHPHFLHGESTTLATTKTSADATTRRIEEEIRKNTKNTAGVDLS